MGEIEFNLDYILLCRLSGTTMYEMVCVTIEIYYILTLILKLFFGILQCIVLLIMMSLLFCVFILDV